MIPPMSGGRQAQDGKNPEKGFYTGQYRRDGSSLIRTSDGLRLVMGDRGPQADPRSSQFYLVDKTPGKGYLSNLYRDQFDDRVFRYQIVWRADDPDTADVVVLYPLKRGRGRGVGHGV